MLTHARFCERLAVQSRRPTHPFICGKSLKGKFLVLRRSRRDRVRAKLQEITEELRQRMHDPISEQGKWLRQVVGGFFAYHAVPTNFATLGTFNRRVMELWKRSLQRRSQRADLTCRLNVPSVAKFVGTA